MEQLSNEMESFKILVREASSHPRYGAMSSKNPVAALEIPNKLVLLWEMMRKMQNQLCTSISKYSELVNISIDGGKVHAIVPSLLETRLQKQVSYICQQHKRLRFGSKRKLEDKATSILLFAGEIILSSNAAPLATPHNAEQSTLQLKGKAYAVACSSV